MIYPYLNVVCHFCGYNCYLKDLSSHYKEIHSWNDIEKNNQNHICVITNCTKTQQSYIDFLIHMFECHNFQYPELNFYNLEIKNNNENIIENVENDSLLNFEKVINDSLVRFFESTKPLNFKVIKSVFTLIHDIFLCTQNFDLLHSFEKSEIFKKFKSLQCCTNEFSSSGELFERIKMKVEKPYLCTIDLKADIEHYLKNEIRLNPSILPYLSKKEELELILYADDCCVGNNIGSGARNITLTNFSYRLFIPQLASSSKLYHYRCVAVAKSRFSKPEKYHGPLEILSNLIKNTKVNISNLQLPLKLLFVTGDNEFHHIVFSVNRYYRVGGKDNCRLCNISGKQWNEYSSCMKLEPYYKSSHNLQFLPKYNNYILDGFHDVHCGVMRYTIKASLDVFIENSNIDKLVLRNSILEYSKTSGYFRNLSTKMVKKIFIHYKIGGKFTNLSGGQTLALCYSFYKFLLTYNFTNNISEIQKVNIQNITPMLKCLLNMCAILSDGSLDYNVSANLWTTNADHFFKGLKITELGKRLNLTTKYHNLLHYPKMITQFKKNPFWMNCIRFESTNLRIKKIASATNSRINICKTIAKQLQWQSFLERELARSNEIDSKKKVWNYNIIDYTSL